MSKSEPFRSDTKVKESSSRSSGLRPQYVGYKNGQPEEAVLTVISYMVISRQSGRLTTRFTVSGDPYWWREFSVPSGFEVSAWSPLPQLVLRSLLDLYGLLMEDGQLYGTITIMLDMSAWRNWSIQPMRESYGPIYLQMRHRVTNLWDDVYQELKRLPRWKDLPVFPGHPNGSKDISEAIGIKVIAEGQADELPVIIGDLHEVIK